MVRQMLEVTRSPGYLVRALDGATRVLQHEVDAVSGHWAEVRERLAVARKSRGLIDLLRTQADLLPETKARLTLDQRERLALLRSWLSDLRQAA